MSDLKKATEVMQLINGNDQQRHKGFDLFNRYFTMEFIRFLQNRGLSYEDAKDVCQMTTIKIFKKADTSFLDEEISLFTYSAVIPC